MSVRAFTKEDLEKLPKVETSALFDEDGTLIPVSADFYSQYPRESLMFFGHQYALYSFPTIEAVEVIKSLINGRESQTIEIGAGNGGWCKALGITGTDSYQQDTPHIRAIYKMTGQPVINYGKHVKRLDALAAVRKHKPKIVVAAWVTHKFDEALSHLGGNAEGVDENKLLDSIDEYIFIGNTHVHRVKPLFIASANGTLKGWKVDLKLSADKRVVMSRSSRGHDFIAHFTRINNA